MSEEYPLFSEVYVFDIGFEIPTQRADIVAVILLYFVYVGARISYVYIHLFV